VLEFVCFLMVDNRFKAFLLAPDSCLFFEFCVVFVCFLVCIMVFESTGCLCICECVVFLFVMFWFGKRCIGGCIGTVFVVLVE